MSIKQDISRLKKKTENLNLKTKELSKSLRELKKSFDKFSTPPTRVSTRKLSLMDKLDADDRLKNLMIPDYKKN